MCFLAIITLILSTVIVMCACYTSFNEKYKHEIRKEASLIADFLNYSCDSTEFARITELQNDDKKIVILQPDGKILYDNGVYVEETGTSKIETEQALESGTGERSRFLISGAKKMFYYAVRLNNGNVLRICAKINGVNSMLFGVLVSVFFMAVLIYLLTAIVASRLTSNIIRPIENINSFETENFDNVYDEIKPFLKRISHQSREINRQMSKIKSQKVRLRAIMDNINEGLLIIDKNSEIVSVNNCATQIFGTEESQLKHKNVSLLTDRDEIQKAFRNALTGTKSNIMFETNNKTYQIFSSPLFEKDSISGAVMLLFDVSEKTQSEKIRREFTANVSHELKTPLTAIHGYAQIIGSGIAKPDDVIGFVKKIEKESSRLIVLVDDIIKLSHLDEMNESVQKQSVSLKSVVNEVIESLSARAEERGVRLNVSGEDSQVTANLSQLTEMIYNLADNSVKYNKNGGTVIFEIQPKKLIVSDTGIGIPDKYLERVFERFFRVDKSHSKKVNGTGLGLSIVKHLAMANNVDISVSSRLGEGTEFVLEFNG